MKKIKTLIAAAVLGLGVTVSSISPAAVSMQTAEAATVKQGLVKVKNKYYYYNAKGKKVKNKWVTVKVKGKKQKYYFNKKGAALTGTAAVKNRLYCFDKKGRLNQKKSKKLAAYRQNSDFAGLKALNGEPKKAEYFDSCMGAGMDGILKYQGFTVYTYKENGKEIIQGFE